MSRTTLNEAAGVWALDRSPEVDGAGRNAADFGALLVHHSEPVVRPLAGGGVFVTPDGAWLREGSGEFFVALGDPNPDYDAPLFAIKNLGFVFVRVVAASLVEITLHPRNVAPAALCSLQQWLQSLQSDSFKLNYMKDVWTSEVLSTPTEVMCRVFEICSLEMSEEANRLESYIASNTSARKIGFASPAH
jgi:hypothetical protein